MNHYGSLQGKAQKNRAVTGGVGSDALIAPQEAPPWSRRHQGMPPYGRSAGSAGDLHLI